MASSKVLKKSPGEIIETDLYSQVMALHRPLYPETLSLQIDANTTRSIYAKDIFQLRGGYDGPPKDKIPPDLRNGRKICVILQVNASSGEPESTICIGRHLEMSAERAQAIDDRESTSTSAQI
jgi:hypothetical protein